MTRRLTPEESARLGHLWTNTEITVAQIAARLKITKQAVYQHATKKLGLPPRKFWTSEEDKRLKQLWPDRELTLGQIAERLGKPKTAAVNYRARILGLSHPRGLHRWTPERNNTLRRLWLEGIGAKEIAKQVNSTLGMVCVQRKKLGLPRRVFFFGRSERLGAR
jgi:hypothetical protein